MEKDDINFIEDIKSGKKDFAFLYNKYYKYSVSVLKKKGASIDDINDIYQDVMILIYNKICSDNFRLTSKLSTYIYSIISNLWYKKLLKKAKFLDVNTSFLHNEGDEVNKKNYAVMSSKNMIYEDVYNEDDMKNLLMKNLIEKLPYKHRQIIELILNGLDSKQIMTEMGFSNTDTVKTLKWKAINNLKTRIEEIKKK